MRDLKNKHVLKYVTPELRMLFQWVEEEFHPLQLCDKVSPLLEHIKTNESLEKYTQPIQQTVLIRLLQQVCGWHVWIVASDAGGPLCL